MSIYYVIIDEEIAYTALSLSKASAWAERHCYGIKYGIYCSKLYGVE